MKQRNNIFSPTRFVQYAARAYGINWKKYLILAGFLFGFMVVSLLVRRLTDGPLDGDMLRGLGQFFFTFVLSMSAVCVVFAEMVPFRNRHTFVAENTLPASKAEQFAFMFLNTTVVFSAVFLLSVLATALFGTIVSTGRAPISAMFEMDNDWLVMWSAMLLVQAGALYAGTMERRYHVVSFMGVVVVAFAVLFLLTGLPLEINSDMSEKLQYGPMFTFDSGGVAVMHAEVSYTNTFSLLSSPYSVIRICLGAAVLLWVCAWFNFRERSIK